MLNCLAMGVQLLRFVVFWALNVLLLWVASSLFGNAVRFDSVNALVLAGPAVRHRARDAQADPGRAHAADHRADAGAVPDRHQCAAAAAGGLAGARLSRGRLLARGRGRACSSRVFSFALNLLFHRRSRGRNERRRPAGPGATGAACPSRSRTSCRTCTAPSTRSSPPTWSPVRPVARPSSGCSPAPTSWPSPPFQLPLGLLLDRFGPRRTDAVCCWWPRCGALLFAAAASVSALTLGRALIGLGVSGCLMSGIKANVLWFPARAAAGDEWLDVLRRRHRHGRRHGSGRARSEGHRLARCCSCSSRRSPSSPPL